MLERRAGVFLIRVAGPLQADNAATQILGVADFGAAHEHHGGVTSQTAEHDNVVVPDRHRNQEKGRHGGEIRIARNESHRRDGAGSSTTSTCNPSSRNKPASLAKYGMEWVTARAA